ncbi:MAG: glycosyltransferase [Pseudomonadota bacterium]
MMQRHIVFATAGSLGDLHPFLALGSEMRRRGYRVTVATNAAYETEVGNAFLNFHHMRPDPEDTPAFHARYMHPATGGEFVYRDYLAPAIQASYVDLLAITQRADLLVSQTLMALAAPLVAAKTNIAWVSAVLQPMSFFSVHDRPNYLPRSLAWACARSPALHARVLHYVKKHTMAWFAPVSKLRHELDISDVRHPLYEGQHSPRRVLAMFSPLMGTAQPDWPAGTVQTGCALHTPETAALPAALLAFVERDDTPLVIFTLSSASSNDAGDFYLQSFRAATALGMRALLIMGGLAKQSRLPEPLPTSVFRVDYVAFEKVFGYAAAIVHSGGSATSFKALQAGKPQIIVPHAHDQRDNAMRLQHLGVAAVIHRHRPGWKALRSAVNAVLNDQAMIEKATAVAARARAKDGVQAACDAIEVVMETAMKTEPLHG